MSKEFAVLGSPISHSKSPAIHAAAYRVLGEEWSYSSVEVPKGGLKRFIETDGVDFSGFSVTMPLKEEAFQLAAQRDRISELTGAANTLVRHADQWSAYNTDVFGITQAITRAFSKVPEKSLIIGSGATATSALVAISILAPESTVGIFARNKVARAQLVAFGKTLGLRVNTARSVRKSMQQSDLTISTLPGGAIDDVATKLRSKKRFMPGGLLLDVAYHPWPSQLANLWSERNQRVVSGLEMLIWQAVAQIRIFRLGDPTIELPNEIAVVQAMHNAVSD